MSRKGESLYHGLLLVNKPVGLSSHDVVAVVRRLAGQRRVGHTGTLDPLAGGLLALLLGEATRLEPYLVKADKLYTGRLELGWSTDTDDASGQTLARREGPWPDESELRAALKSFEGEREQVPPAFSAVKVNGRRAYQAARAGEKLELKARRVRAELLELRSYQPPEAEFSAQVSSGYYIRSLVRDLGLKLGLGAAMTALRRERVGPWPVERAVSLDEIRNWSGEDWRARLLSPSEALPDWPEAIVDGQTEADLRQGRTVQAPGSGLERPPQLKILNGRGELVCLARTFEEAGGGKHSPSRPESSQASLGGSSPQRPFLRPLRVFNFSKNAEQPDGKE